MSPKAKHIPESASRTTIRLPDEEVAAINWLRLSRLQKGNDRMNLK